MRHAFWLLLMAFALSALFGGYFSGRAAVPRFPALRKAAAATATPAADPLVPSALAQTDQVAQDRFARDPAVVLGSSDAGNLDADASLAVVLVDAGHSQALEAPFLSLGIPVTVVIDPSGAAARSMYLLARSRGAAIYLQAHAPLGARSVERLRRSFANAQGIAMRLGPEARLPAATARALRAAHFAVFDEDGAYARAGARLAATGVRYAARGVTIDNHSEPTYVAYMLRQAVHLARGRRAVVMARPFPGTLQAFRNLLARAPREGVRFVALP